MFNSEKIRNIALIGHSGEGKTTLAEAMLYKAGVITRMGNIEEGNTVMDFEEEEIKRKSSISLAVASVPWKDCKLNVIDVPGFLDFEGELTSALEVVGAAVIVTAATGQVSVGTEMAIDELSKRNIPGIIFINQVDKENYNFSKTYQALREEFLGKIAIISVPMVKDDIVYGFLNVFEKKGYDLEGNPTEIADYLLDKVDMFHTQLAELAAESDEELLDRYFSGEPLTVEEITKGIKTRQHKDGILLVMGGSALYKKGVTNLMDRIIQVMRHPDELPAKIGYDSKNNEIQIKINESKPAVLQVFKTIADPFVGKLTLFKVINGKVKSGMVLKNTKQDKEEKIGTIYMLQGKKQVPCDEGLCAGDIGAVAKLLYTKTGDTLCDVSLDITFPEIQFPQPSIALAISSLNKGEEDKVFAGFAKLEDEDSTFKIKKNSETNEILIYGLGEIQLEVLCKKLKTKYKVEAKLDEPKIAFRETIKKKVEAEGKHKKQSGGHGQYGHVKIRFEPNSNSDFEFATEVVGGAVPKNYFPAVEKGLKECIQKGVLAGYPVVNIKATLYDGSYHDVDSNELSFVMAASLAYKSGLKEAAPVLLEPILNVTIRVPETFLGDILGDITKRRGRVLGMESEGKYQIVNAEIPEVELCKYTTDLRSMTQGRGKFTTQLARYEEMPITSAQKIIDSANKE